MWSEHEEAMESLMHKFPAGEGVSTREYLSSIYQLATGRKAAERVAAKKMKTTMKKMAESAKRAGSSRPGVSETRVAKAPNKMLDFDEAFEAAVREHGLPPS